jgi:SAM-dependent methyltransferase
MREATLLCVQRYGLFDDSDLPRETDIVRCAACGTVHASSQAGASAYRAHYARHSKYDTAEDASGSGSSAEDRQRLRETATFLAGRWDRSARVLDIGAGRGGLLSALREMGFNALDGIDPSEGCASAMRRGGFTAARGVIEDDVWPTDPRRFDAIVLSHVLEHVHDVGAALARVGQRLAADGEIYVEVPDASRYTVDGFPPFYFFDPEHINHFDLPSLDQLASSHGWAVAESWTRELTLAGGRHYPAIGVRLRRGAGPKRRTPTHDPCVERYVAASRAMLDSDATARAIAMLAGQGSTLVVWGAGSHAQRLLAQTALAGARIECIIDSDRGKQGRLLAGHRIVAPDEGLSRAEAIGATLLIAIAVDPQPVVELVRIRAPAVPVFVA